MNAVTTAEYVVLEQIDPNTFQQEINAHSKAGYRMVSTHVIFDDSNRTVLYNAVMVREITHMSALAERVVAIAEDIVSLETRLSNIEAKIDWSK